MIFIFSIYSKMMNTTGRGDLFRQASIAANRAACSTYLNTLTFFQSINNSSSLS
jgi:hypothetical protein